MVLQETAYKVDTAN